MSCKQLYFVRHGETALNASGCLQGSGTDDGLSAKGRHQAEFQAEGQCFWGYLITRCDKN